MILPDTLPEHISLILPDQLFAHHPVLNRKFPALFVEEQLWYREFKFHILKLWFHQQSGKAWIQQAREKGFDVYQIKNDSEYADIRNLIKVLHSKGVGHIHLTEVTDDWFVSRITRVCERFNIQLSWYPSPAFLTTLKDAEPHLYQGKKFYQTGFYIWQRKRLNILTENGKPQGGKWTYDADNRKKLPKGFIVPKIEWPAFDSACHGLTEWKNQFWKNNPGRIQAFESSNHFYPTTNAEAEVWLHQFLTQRFHHFGLYEDALSQKHPFVFHSLLSPLLNVGLLTPDQVLDAALQIADKQNIPLNSLEGFIRQIIGWREFIRLVYLKVGGKQRTRNFFEFSRKMPKSFLKGQSGLFPVDHCVEKIQETGYLHHIERLMIMGNYLLLCEINPDAVYSWFMEGFLDAYDWVMVPNVYGMSQFADGGMMTTKPYVSGSNYILKMSDYPSGDWTETWDGLFWRFITRHREVFGNNPRTSLLLSSWEKKSATEKSKLLNLAETHLAQL